MTVVKKTKIILVTAPPWYGKSFITMFFSAYWYYVTWNKRIYSNLEFFYKWKKFTRDIKKVDDIKYIEESEIPWLIIMDEMGGNANPRKSMDEKNIDIVTELTIYPRKKNCSVVFCAQVDNMYDVYIRKTAYAEFELLPPFSYYEDWREMLIFKANIKRNGEVVKYVELDLFILLDMGFSFDTMSKSLIEDKKKMKVDTNKTYDSKEELEKVMKEISI